MVLRTSVLLATVVAALGASAAAAAGANTTDRRTASAVAAQPRVVGGSAVAITEVPFQVALWDPSVRDGGADSSSPYLGQFCGGSIVGPTHVVTAAHCLQLDGGGTKVPSTIRVLAGSALLPARGQSAAPGYVDVAVSSLAVAPGYDASTSDLDVAVLTLAEPVYSGSPTIDGRTPIAPIALAGAVPGGGQLTRLSGWGDMNSEPTRGEPNPSYPQDLQAAKLAVVDDATCRRGYEREGLRFGRHVLCAGGGVPDACFGDSGGPLTHQSGGVPTLAGVVGSGFGCAQPGFPSLYASVADPAVGDVIRSVVPTTTPIAPSPAPAPAPPAPTPDAPAPAPVAVPPAPSPGLGSATATPPADRTRPVTRLASRSCSRNRCAVNVRVTDAAPSSGIRLVGATLRWNVRVSCVRDGRRTRCTRTRSRRLSPRAIGGGHYAVVATALARRRTHTLTLVARDRAGNRQRRAIRLRLRTR